MKKALFWSFIFLFAGVNSLSFAQSGSGAPLKFISSCEIDLNNDNEPDIALFVETLKGVELIILIRTSQGFEAYRVPFSKGGHWISWIFSCHYGDTVKETIAGKGKKTSRKVYKTSGAYIQLTHPEGPSVVYFLSGKKIKEVWTSD